MAASSGASSFRWSPTLYGFLRLSSEGTKQNCPIGFVWRCPFAANNFRCGRGHSGLSLNCLRVPAFLPISRTEKKTLGQGFRNSMICFSSKFIPGAGGFGRGNSLKAGHRTGWTDWLSDMDSNHDKLLQRELCYHYTIGQAGIKLAFPCQSAKENMVRAGPCWSKTP